MDAAVFTRLCVHTGFTLRVLCLDESTAKRTLFIKLEFKTRLTRAIQMSAMYQSVLTGYVKPGSHSMYTLESTPRHLHSGFFPFCQFAFRVCPRVDSEAVYF